MAGTTDLNGDRIAAWRKEAFLSLGFSETDAEKLIEARGTDGFRLSHHDVRRYFEHGATHEQIVRIFT